MHASQSIHPPLLLCLILTLPFFSPTFQVSRTRLSVRNLPSTVDERQLKQMFLDAAAGVPGEWPNVVQVKLQKDPERKNKSKVYKYITMHYTIMMFLVLVTGVRAHAQVSRSRNF